MEKSKRGGLHKFFARLRPESRFPSPDHRTVPKTAEESKFHPFQPLDGSLGTGNSHASPNRSIYKKARPSTIAAPPPRFPIPGQRTVIEKSWEFNFSTLSAPDGSLGTGNLYARNTKKPPTLAGGRLLDSKNSRSEELFVFRSFGLTCQYGSRNSRIGICFP